MKATNNISVSKSEVMKFAHKLLSHWGHGLFAWSWSTCMKEAWRQMKIIAHNRFIEQRRIEVRATSTTWIPTESDQNALYNWYHN